MNDDIETLTKEQQKMKKYMKILNIVLLIFSIMALIIFIYDIVELNQMEFPTNDFVGPLVFLSYPVILIIVIFKFIVSLIIILGIYLIFKHLFKSYMKKSESLKSDIISKN